MQFLRERVAAVWSLYHEATPLELLIFKIKALVPWPLTPVVRVKVSGTKEAATQRAAHDASSHFWYAIVYASINCSS